MPNRQSAASLIATLAVLLGTLAGCGGDDPAAEPSGKSSSANPSGQTEPDLPNIALQEDGETPILCQEWPELSDDIQHGMVFNALVKVGEAPATDAKVDKARKVVNEDCTSEPDSVAYVVALRAATSANS
jgi:hypothetical protein